MRPTNAPDLPLDDLPDAVLTVDGEFRPRAWNREAARLLGPAVKTASKRNLIRLLRIHRPEFRSTTPTRWSGRVEGTTPDGVDRVFDVHVLSGRGDRVVVARDVTASVRRDQELIRTARYDDLTGLPGRTLFTEHLSRSIRRFRIERQGFAVVFADLDRFKQINDTFGHRAGDEVLRRVSHRVQDTIRPGDLLARIGGDEFALLLPNVDSPAMAERIGRRVLAAFSGPVRIGSSTVMTSASLGIAWSTSTDTSERMLDAADRAMYGAKRTGRGGLLLAPITLPSSVQTHPAA